MLAMRKRWVLVAPLLVFVFAVGVAAAQSAEDVTRSQPFELRINSLVVMIAVGSIIPVVTGLVTKLHAHDALKGGITILLSAITALAAQATINDGVSVISKQALILFFVGLVQAEAAYYGLWKPVNAQANLAPRVGLGPANPPPPAA